jgi:hypothetical protein
MTLVLVIPAKDGTVVAADSRATASGRRSFDGRKKLHIAETTPKTVFAITGAADFPNSIQAGGPLEEWSYAFRSRDAVCSYLAKRVDFVLTEQRTREIAEVLAVSVGSFLRRCGKHREFVGRGVSRLVLCQFDALSRSSLYGSVEVTMNDTGEVSLAGGRFERYLCDGVGWIERIGEGIYLDEAVLNGPGRDFLSHEASALLSSNYQIKDLDKLAASRIAVDIIQAAERTTGVSPTPSGHGIGGPVMRVILDASGASSI